MLATVECTVAGVAVALVGKGTEGEEQGQVTATGSRRMAGEAAADSMTRGVAAASFVILRDPGTSQREQDWVDL